MDEPNPLVAWRVGERKSPAYAVADVIDSRRLPAEVINAAQLAGSAAAHLRLDRVCREQGFEYHFQAHAFLRERAEAKDASREWPVVDTQEWTVHSDQVLTGEALAEALGLDDEWRTILDLPPNTGLSWEQFQRLANLALIRNYMHAVDVGWAELTGMPADPRPSLQEAAEFLERVRKDDGA